MALHGFSRDYARCFLNGVDLDKNRGENSYLIRSEDSLPVFDERECAIYMSAKHHIPLQLCTAYVHSKKRLKNLTFTFFIERGYNDK